MQAQSPSVINKQKLAETVEKYVDLIKENKVYEFTQKIQLLTHRKQQTKKFEEAQFLLMCGIQKLFTFSSSQQNEAFSLLDHLLKIYEAHAELWNLEKAKKIYELLNIKPVDRKYEYYVRFLKTLKNQPFPKELLLDLIRYYMDRNQFTKAESHVLQLDLSFVKSFLQKWSEKVSSEEAIAIQCRLALLRGLFENFQECEVLLEGANRESPFFRFAHFLISAAKLKSKEAYSLIGSRYKQFLDSDQIYSKIYEGYGTYYFKINPASKGNSLFSLFH